MLVLLFLQIIYSIVFVLTFWMPEANPLPYGMDQVLSTAVGYFNYFSSNNWPFVYPMVMAIAYFGFVIGMIILRTFLGHRAPKIH